MCAYVCVCVSGNKLQGRVTPRAAEDRARLQSLLLCSERNCIWRARQQPFPLGPQQALFCEEVGWRARGKIKVKTLSGPHRKIQSPFAVTVISPFCPLAPGGRQWYIQAGTGL